MQAEGLVGAGSQKALQQWTEKQFGSNQQAFRAGYRHQIPVEQVFQDTHVQMVTGSGVASFAVQILREQMPPTAHAV